MKKSFAKKVYNWTDDECLEAVALLLERVDVDTRFIRNEDNLITHQMVIIGCGDKVIASDPMKFDWPLQQLPVPEALEPSVG